MYEIGGKKGVDENGKQKNRENENERRIIEEDGY